MMTKGHTTSGQMSYWYNFQVYLKYIYKTTTRHDIPEILLKLALNINQSTKQTILPNVLSILKLTQANRTFLLKIVIHVSVCIFRDLKH
jgi:hypothetical protein